MTRKGIAALFTLLLTACPHNGPDVATPEKDPYAIARAVVQTAQLSLLAADGVFEIWAGFAEPAKATEARVTYTKIRTAVVDGLKVAMDGINIAESQKEGLDLPKLLAQAEAAYQDLRAFLGILTGGASSQPSPRSGFGAKYKAPAVQDLPPSLLPVK